MSKELYKGLEALNEIKISLCEYGHTLPVDEQNVATIEKELQVLHFLSTHLTFKFYADPNNNYWVTIDSSGTMAFMKVTKYIFNWLKKVFEDETKN